MNVVEENANGVGSWGGLCRCPDGKEYFVGDNHDECNTIACVGGEKKYCNEYIDDRWAQRKVTCEGNVFEIIYNKKNQLQKFK